MEISELLQLIHQGSIVTSKCGFIVCDGAILGLFRSCGEVAINRFLNPLETELASSLHLFLILPS
jgi:hypothetical protein